ncbi:thyrotropin-releasing hormone receptor-like [Amphiura filiformis]|uniref:thyrotropin-releasing hormone receptor-like n=1 Tax=Amphiura filiformis TaxID=82378 RepID=UPI003B2108C0
MDRCDLNFTSDQYQYSTLSWSVVLIFVPLVSAFGIFCNLTFIFVVYKVPYMRNITNIFLVNLSIADSSLLAAGGIQYIGDYIVSPKYDLQFSFHTLFGCIVPDFMTYLFFNASLWIITVVSIERYLAICRPLWHRRSKSKRRALRMVMAAWIASALFASFSTPKTVQWYCLISSNAKIIQRVPACRDYCDSCHKVLNILDLTQFVVALIVNTVMYALIVLQLSKSPFSDQNSPASENRANQARNAVARMLIINGIVFFICLFPYSIINVIRIGEAFHVFVVNASWRYTLAWVARIFFLINSTLNPLVYNATNARYRLAFKQAFGLEKNHVRKDAALLATNRADIRKSQLSNRCTRI